VTSAIFRQAAASEPVSQGPGCTLGKADSSSAKGSDPMGFFHGIHLCGDGLYHQRLVILGMVVSIWGNIW